MKESRDLCLSTTTLRIMLFLILFCTLPQICSSTSTEPGIIVPEFLIVPTPVNAIEGSVVTFTCLAEAYNEDEIVITLVDFILNGEVLPFSTDRFHFYCDRPLGPGSQRCIVRFVASAAYNNNSEISCQATPYPETTRNLVVTIFSDNATLRVQGPLSSVGDLSYSFVDSLTVNISWSPPFTLPGTDITGYNISATSNGTTTNYFTSNSYYQLSLTDIISTPCEFITVNVSGYNGFNGEITTIKVPFLLIDIPLILFVKNKNYISVIINDSVICPEGDWNSLISELIDLELSLISRTITTAKKVSIRPSFVSSQHEDPRINVTAGADEIPIEPDQMYTVNVSLTLFNGSYSYNESIEIDTYDPVSARVFNSSNSSAVCVECEFSPFSSDNSSCIVELISSTNTTKILTLYRITDTEVAVECFDPETDGNFTVHVLEPNSTIRSFDVGTVTVVPTGTTSHYPTATTTSYDPNTGSSIPSIIPSSSVTTSPVTNNHDKDTPLWITLVEAFCWITFFLIVGIIVLATIMYLIIIKRKQKKLGNLAEEQETKESRRHRQVDLTIELQREQHIKCNSFNNEFRVTTV